MAENFSIVGYIWISLNRSTPRHIIIKLSKIKDKKVS